MHAPWQRGVVAAMWGGSNLAMSCVHCGGVALDGGSNVAVTSGNAVEW